MPEACEGAIRYMPFTMVRTDDGTYVYGGTHLDLSDGDAGASLPRADQQGL